MQLQVATVRILLQLRPCRRHSSLLSFARHFAMASSGNKVIIYGGAGALGRVCVDYFKEKSWWVASIDLTPNEKADVNIPVGKNNTSSEEQSKSVESQLNSSLKNEKVDAILCFAGGWAGGNAASKDFLGNSDLMWKQSVWSSQIAAQVACNSLKEGGLLVLTGAQAALDPTPGMIGYGMAKAAVLHLTKSLGAEKSGMPKNAAAVAILPVTLDTPMNRKWMPKADFTSWTPLEFVAETSFKWATSQERPGTGSLIQLITKDSKTNLVPAKI